MPDGFRCLDAVHVPFKADIHEDQVRPQRVGAQDRLFTGADHVDDRIAEPAEAGTDIAGDDAFIFDNQDARGYSWRTREARVSCGAVVMPSRLHPFALFFIRKDPAADLPGVDLGEILPVFAVVHGPGACFVVGETLHLLDDLGEPWRQSFMFFSRRSTQPSCAQRSMLGGVDGRSVCALCRRDLDGRSRGPAISRRAAESGCRWR